MSKVHQESLNSAIDIVCKRMQVNASDFKERVHRIAKFIDDGLSAVGEDACANLIDIDQSGISKFRSCQGKAFTLANMAAMIALIDGKVVDRRLRCVKPKEFAMITYGFEQYIQTIQTDGALDEERGTGTKLEWGE